MEFPEFKPFPKLARLSREATISEKIDGTNAQVFITESGDIFAASRTRWISVKSDNFGFAQWVERNKTELLKLGPGQHFGEWYGVGIQRGYSLTERRFALFNTSRWLPRYINPNLCGVTNSETGVEIQCCYVVPTIWKGIFNTSEVSDAIAMLEVEGSFAVPGFRNPEGVVVYHSASGLYFKKTVKDDEKPKTFARSECKITPEQMARGVESAQDAFKRAVEEASRTGPSK